MTLSGIANVIPDVRGLTRHRAIQTLQDAGLDVSIAKATAAPDQLTPAGQVAGQTPAGGTMTLPTGTVTLTLTAGSDVTLPVPPRPAGRPALKTPGPVTDNGGGITGNQKLPDFLRPRPPGSSAKPQ